MNFVPPVPGLPSDGMALQNRLNAMSRQERKVAASVITNEQYEAFHDRKWPKEWSPSNDEEWLAVWARNRDASGWTHAGHFGNRGTYVFTLPARPVEMVITELAKRYPSDYWESVAYLALVPMYLFSAYVWYRAGKFVMEMLP